jgi:hypothetical protein
MGRRQLARYLATHAKSHRKDWRRKMSEAFSAELFRQAGAAFRSIRLHVQPDGSVKIEAQDLGESARGCEGEYEFWVDVPAEAIRKLVFSLLREKYSGRSGAVDEFNTFCKKEEVEGKWGCWF